MSFSNVTKFFAVLALPACVSSAAATTTALFEFTGGSSAGVLSTTGNAAITSITAMTANGGGGGFSSMFDNAFYRSSNTSSTLFGAGSVDYFSFTPTLGGTAGAAGYCLDSLSFDYFIQDIFQDFTWNIDVVADLDGNGTWGDPGEVLGTSSLTGASGSGTVNPSPTNAVSVNLSTVAGLQNLAAGATPEFRLYVSDPSTGSNRIHRIDNVALVGSVKVEEIPEPSRAMLLLVAAGACLFRRRR